MIIVVRITDVVHRDDCEIRLPKTF